MEVSEQVAISLTKNAIKNISIKAGIVYASKDIYKESREAVENISVKLIVRSCLFLLLDGRKTLSEKYVRMALSLNNIYPILPVELEKAKDSLQNANQVYYKCETGKNRPRGFSKTMEKLEGDRRNARKSTLTKIRCLQRNSNNIFFQRKKILALVKNIILNSKLITKKDIRISGKALILIQFYIEQYLLSLFVRAHLLAISEGKETLTGKNIQMIAKYSREIDNC